MFLTKWVEMTEMFDYFACVKVFKTYDEARDLQVSLENISCQQQNDEYIYKEDECKIISDIDIEEINII